MKAEQEAIPHGDPFALFEAWFAEARGSEPNDPNAMALATATPDGRPSARMVLLKGHGDALGTVHYNRALAAKRAEMVAKALLGHGVAERQLTQVIGDDDDPNSPEVRRVELIYR